MHRSTFILILTGIILFLDIYIYFGLKFMTRDLSPKYVSLAKMGYWLLSAMVLFSLYFLLYNYTGKNTGFWPKAMISLIMISVLSKIGGFAFLFIDDLVRLSQYVVKMFQQGSISPQNTGIGRKDFLVKTGALFATSIGAAMTYGVTKGSHRYRIIRQKLALKNLPDAFVGIKIIQISDIHSGSFWNKDAVQKGVDLIVKENADLIFFTGDIVNNDANEMKDYLNVFNKVKAPLGVFSILGNHDYGEYMPQFKKDDLTSNIQRITEVHNALGWQLLRNENRFVEKDGERISLIGVENWSNKMHFSRYGDLAKAVEGADSTVKLLLSHDPSHWRGEILEKYPDIQATFSGHTHGMQFGIETAGFKWSPVKYAYPEWAGMYKEGDQHLYVNRGFGYLGFPGRLGIWPEITVFELKKA